MKEAVQTFRILDAPFSLRFTHRQGKKVVDKFIVEPFGPILGHWQRDIRRDKDGSLLWSYNVVFDLSA